MNNKLISFWLAAFIFIPQLLFASSDLNINRQDKPNYLDVIKSKLEFRYRGCEIELLSDISWIQGDKPVEINQIVVFGDDSRGQAILRVRGRSEANKMKIYQAKIDFSAWMNVPIAVRKILPMEKLSEELFIVQRIDVARGKANQYRTLIVPEETKFHELEARQTILPGQFPLMNQVQKIPAVRRGDVLNVKIFSGGLVLSTRGIAQETGHNGQNLRVLTRTTKKELTGKLDDKGSLEVRL